MNIPSKASEVDDRRTNWGGIESSMYCTALSSTRAGWGKRPLHISVALTLKTSNTLPLYLSGRKYRRSKIGSPDFDRPSPRTEKKEPRAGTIYGMGGERREDGRFFFWFASSYCSHAGVNYLRSRWRIRIPNRT